MRSGLMVRMRPAFFDWSLLHHRTLIIRLIVHEVRSRYRASYLGVLWSLVTPMVLLAIYSFVFSAVLKPRWEDEGTSSSAGFALTLFAGLIPFTVFAEVLNGSPSLITRVPNYVKKVIFPLEILPVVAVGAALVQSLIWVVVLLLGLALLQGRISATLALLPLAYVPLALLCLAVSWFVSSLGVYVRDIAQGTSLVAQGILFLTPIFYPFTAVPSEYRAALFVNPLTTIVSGFRQVLLWSQPLSWGAWGGWTLVSALLCWAAYGWFRRTRVGFIDVL